MINEKVTDGKVYICEYCGLVATFSQAMRLHMQKHFKEIEDNKSKAGLNWREYEFEGEEV